MVDGAPIFRFLALLPGAPRFCLLRPVVPLRPFDKLRAFGFTTGYQLPSPWLGHY